MGYNIHEHKRYYYTFDNSLLFTESICEITQIFSTLNHNVRFPPSAPGRWHNAIRTGILLCGCRFNYSRTLPQRSSPSGCGHS